MKKKKSNDFSLTTTLDLYDLITIIGLIAICVIGIGFTILSIIMVIVILF